MRKIMAMLSGCGLVLASAASATPVARQADLTLTLTFRGLGGISVSATGATVMVDDSGGLGGAGQITVAAGAIALATPVIIPVTSSTAIASLTATTIANLGGAFSIGGAGTGVPTTEFPCPSPPLASGIACVGQAGLGGVMGLSGTVNVWVGPVRIPVNLNFIQIGLGGALTGFPLTVDAAPWTLETSSVAFLTTTTYMTLSMGTSITVTNMSSRHLGVPASSASFLLRRGTDGLSH